MPFEYFFFAEFECKLKFQKSTVRLKALFRPLRQNLLHEQENYSPKQIED